MVLVRVLSSAVKLSSAVLLAAGIGGCQPSPASPSNNAPYSQTDLREGTGAEAVSGGPLTVHYTGWFYDASRPDQKGAQFDSSVGGAGFSFTVGTGQVISGWDRGVVGMKVGGLRRLVIPPSLGYGSARNGSIPPNATLLFEIELVEIESAEAQ